LPPKTHFYTLDGFRGIAALVVLVFHSALFLGGQFAPLGYAAVDLFFLLSGVVIETSYGARVRAGMPVSAFLRVRLIRLYPLYALSILMMLLAIVLAPHQGVFINASSRQVPVQGFWQISGLSLLGLPIWNVLDMYPLNQPAWSLFFELIANVVWLMLAPRLTTRLLLGIVTLGFVGLLLNHHYPANNRMLDGLSRVGFSFFLGVLLARYPLPQQRRGYGAAVLLAICAVFLCLRPSAGTIFAIWLGLVTLAFPMLVWTAMAVQPERCLAKLCTMFGNLSYPVYLFQTAMPPLLFYDLMPWLHLGSTVSAPWAGLTLVALLYLISGGANAYFDAPVRRWVTAIGQQRQVRVLDLP
jgi:peptidoglycan/LPS O-acetylase OafA/YrhL